MMFTLLVLSAIVVLLTSIFAACRHLRPPLQPLFPPGPKPIPFIGNLHQIPKADAFRVYAGWTTKYGPIIFFRVFGRQFVLLNRLEHAQDLFEKRSALYSTKPRLVMAGELVARVQTSILFLPYNDCLKQCRRFVYSWIGKHSIVKTYDVQEKIGSEWLLQALLKDPAGFSEHIRTAIGSVVLKLTYGINCSSAHDRNIEMAERLTKITAEASQPGRWLCDSFPLLAHLPSWLPGTSFKTWAKEAREVSMSLVHDPFNMVKKAVNDGSAPKSWVAESIVSGAKKIKQKEEENAIMIAAGTMYSGAIDTTVSALRTFFLLMAAHPEIQKKAQAEIDAVIGSNRLPNMNDRDSLPYMNAVITEILRYAAIIPLVPHSLDRDDIYEGYLIPRGTWVMVNVWAILHNPAVYQSPEAFRPERFYPKSRDDLEPDPTKICFGFGRRSCPGYHLAMTSIFLNITRIIAMFNISPIKNDAGEYETLDINAFDTGLIRSPRKFNCSITVRDKDKILLVH